MSVLPRGLRAQLSASIALVVLLVVGLAGLAVALRIDHRDRTDVDRTLTQRADRVRDDADKLLSTGDSRPQDDYGGLLAGSSSLVRLIAGGTVVAERGDPPATPVPVPSATGFTTVTVDGVPWRSLVEPLDPASGDRLQVLQSLEAVDQRLDDNRRLVGLAALVAAVLAAAGVWAVAGLVLKPLQRLRAGALAIQPAAEWRSARFPEIARPREVADLSTTLNAMVDRLHTSMLSTRRFTADAGHEMRTPLASLGADLESLRRNPDLPAGQRAETLAAMSSAYDRVVALLDGLQALARGDAGALPERAPVDVGDLVEEAVRQAARRHPDVTYTAAVGPATVEGWPAGLRLAVDNLLDNAARHGRPAGHVRVDLHGEGGAVRIVVTDDGPGIPADLRDRMRQRFARGPDVRGPGSGLGLALVDQQAALHGGRLDLDDAPGGGLRATFSLK